MNILTRQGYNSSPQNVSAVESVTPVYASKWNMSGGKYTVLLRATLLISVVAFLQGYLTASSHFMVNHMDTVFRLNQGSSEIDYTKNRNKLDNSLHHNYSASVLSTSIITNFHYVYASDTYPQTEGSSSSSGGNQRYHQSEHLFRTQGFSTFARGWVVFMLLGQALGSAFAWKFTDTLGRQQTILLATSTILVLLCFQVLATPDMGTFTYFSISPSSEEALWGRLHSPFSSTVRIVTVSFTTSYYVVSWLLRFVIGVPLGVLLITAILYASELPLPQERGHFMSYLPLAFLGGIWLALLITLVLHHHVDMNDVFSFLPHSHSQTKENLTAYSRAIHILGNEWRWHLFIPFLCCVALLVGFMSSTNWLILTPESPYWLLANDSTTMSTTALSSTTSSNKKKFLNTKRSKTETTRINGGDVSSSNPTTEKSMDAFTSLLLIRGGGKTSTALREVYLEFANMYRALAQDAVSEQSWRDLCMGTSDISLRYRLLLLCILMVVQVMLGPYLLFEMSRWFSLLLLGRDPYMGGDDDENDEIKFIHYQLSHYSFWLSLYPSDTYLFEGVLASCVLLAAMGGVLIGREYLDPVVLRSGYSHGESIGRRSLLLTGLGFLVLFVVCFVITIHFHEWKYDEMINVRNLFWEYLIKYLCFGWLCFMCLAYYSSVGLTMWILPVEVWGLRYRAKCLSSCYVVYFNLLALCYLVAFWSHNDGDTEKSLEEQALLAPSSLQRNLMVYATLITVVGVYVFLALPETTGLMFEDSDELFSLEEYDVIGFCFPRGSGSGYLGFRTFEQINLRFHIYFVPSKPVARPSQSQIPPIAPAQPPLRSSSYTAAGNPSGSSAGIAGGVVSSKQPGHAPVPIMQSYDQRGGVLGTESRLSSNNSSLASTNSPQSQQMLGVGPHINLHQARCLTGYGSASSTPTRTTAPIHLPPILSADSAVSGTVMSRGMLGQHTPHGSALFLPDLPGDDDEDDAQHMFHEHKYSTHLRSGGFQYLEPDDENEGMSIHTTALFHTEKAKSNSFFSNR